MPIFGKSPPRPPTGAPIGRRQKATLDVIRQLSQIGGGRGVMWSPSGPQILQPGTTIRLGYASAGLTARSDSTLGYGTVEEFSINQTDPTTATIKDYGVSFTAFNYSNTEIKAGKYVIVSLMWGIWVVISAEC